MLGTQLKKNFSSSNQKNLNKTVAILANSKSGDIVGQKIMQNLKAVSGVNDFNFFGYGGEHMKQEGMAGNIQVELDDFMGKEFSTFRKTKNYSEIQYSTKYSFVNLINKHFVQRQDDILDQFDRVDVGKKIYQARPSVVLNIDNEYITLKMMEDLSKHYKNSANDLPQRHFHNKFVKDYKQWALKYLDFVHYQIPMVFGSADGFTFPGEYVGQYAVYEAIRHIYSKSKDLQPLIKEESLYVNKNYFAADLEKGIEKVRREFREKHQIEQHNTVVFFAPGNELKEAEFCVENVRRGIKEFILKYSSPTSLSPKAPPRENYVTVISVEKGSEVEQYVKQHLEDQPWTGRVVFVSNENNEHIDAMAASDFGLSYDGQMIGAAAVCHLPMMILVKMRVHHQWFSDLYNQWWNQMNIIADNNIYPELIGGEAWYGKICDTLAEWYVKPEVRFDLIRKWEYFIKDACSFQRIDHSKVKGRDIILADGLAYDEIKDPFRQVARHLWKDIQNYELRGGQAVEDFSSLETRVPKLY
eukprot:403364304